MENKIDAAKTLLRPFIPRALLRARAERLFFSEQSWHAKHLGAFASFEEANAYIGQRRLPAAGYTLDHEKWLEERHEVACHDYPPLFWISKLIDEHGLKSLVDFGGSAGVSYYAFRNYLTLPADFTWNVCELPEAVEVGTRVARSRGESQLQFFSDPARIADSPLFYASGVLHYLQDSISALLHRNGAQPDHLVINKLPVSWTESLVTVEGGGNSFYPCRVQKYDDFIAELDSMGYGLIDEWPCPQHRMEVSLRPDLDSSQYRGFVFAKSASAATPDGQKPPQGEASGSD